MKKRMKKGDRVKIYVDPLNKTNFEGMAKLLSRIQSNPLFEVWNVRFDDKTKASRVIKRED